METALAIIIFFGLLVVFGIVMYIKNNPFAGMNEKFVEYFHFKKQKEGGNIIVLRKRDPKIRKFIKVSKVIIPDIKYNPAQYIYTSATVGGITTGGITKIGDNYSYSYTGTNKCALYIKSKKLDIQTIQTQSQEIIESAKNHPIVKKFVNGNQIVLLHEASPNTTEKLKHASTLGNAPLFKSIAKQYYIETRLTKDECEAILDWLCSKDDSSDFMNSSSDEKMKYYKELLDSGKITKKEYEEMKEILK